MRFDSCSPCSSRLPCRRRMRRWCTASHRMPRSLTRRQADRLAARERRRAAGIFHPARRPHGHRLVAPRVSSWPTRRSSSATSSSRASSRRSIDETWEQPWGERRFVRNRCTEQRVTLREKTGPRRGLTVVFRVFDDGVGFRYEFPEQASLAQVDIVEELTEFDVAEAGHRMVDSGRRMESLRISLSEDAARRRSAQAHTPMTLKTASGVHIAIHEAALVDYAGMWLRRVSGQRLKAVLSPSSSGPAGEPQGAVRDAVAHAADRTTPRPACTCRTSSSISTSLTSSAMCPG